MLSKAKHLSFSGGYEDEILRLRLRMTLRHSLLGERVEMRGSPVEGEDEKAAEPIGTQV
jgi:hypothetical protein